MEKAGERVWGESVMTWKPFFLLGEPVGIARPLEVIPLLCCDLLLGSPSVSGSIQGTASEVNCGMCWVQNTNTSVEATFPDFRELYPGMMTIRYKVIWEKEKKDKEKQISKHRSARKPLFQQHSFPRPPPPTPPNPQRSRKSTSPESWLNSVKLLWFSPCLCFAHAVPSLGNALHSTSGPKTPTDPSRTSPGLPSPWPLIIIPAPVGLFVFVDADTPCTQLHHDTLWYILMVACMYVCPAKWWFV